MKYSNWHTKYSIIVDDNGKFKIKKTFLFLFDTYLQKFYLSKPEFYSLIVTEPTMFDTAEEALECLERHHKANTTIGESKL